MKPTVESSGAHPEPAESARSSEPRRDQRNQPAAAAAAGPSPNEAGFVEPGELSGVLAEMVEREVSRRFQSAKDKRWAQLEKQYRRLSQLAAAAESAEEQAAEPEIPDDLEQRLQRLADLPGLRANQDAAALLLRHKTSAGLPGYLDLVEGLLDLTLGAPLTRPAQPASAATAVSPGGSSAPDDLTQAYQQRKARLRPGDVNALTALKREFRRKGLEIW